jgi:hypothetical protein
MTTENNWLTHNLYERINNKNSNFNTTIEVKNYRPISFEQASQEVCEKLYSINNNIYIGLSGGLDSEYVFKKFHSLKIPFTPVIVYGSCYKYESDYAFQICKKYDIEPKVINIDEKNIILKHKFEIYDILGSSSGVGTIPTILVTEYAKENNGIYLKGEHIVGDIDNKVSTELNEWDFYNDVLCNGYTYDFFLYTPEIVYSMVSEMVTYEDKSSQEFKCKLFDIQYRDKKTVRLSGITSEYFHWLKEKRKCMHKTGWKMEPKLFLERYFDESKQIK